MPPARWFPRARAPYAVFVVALALTVLGALYVLRTARTRDELRFKAQVEEARQLIETRIHSDIEVLRAGRALFGASDSVTSDEFGAFVRHLHLSERHPGIQGLGFAKRVVPGGLDVAVWPDGERDEYTSIVYLEPLDARNRRAIGYDMFSDPVRRAAMERARDTGEPAASAKVTLVQEVEAEQPQAGFLIYVPVYDRNVTVTTVEDRRAAIIGYVYSPFRADNLLRGILGRRDNDLAFRVFDGVTPNAANQMHASVPAGTASAPDEELHSTYVTNVAGRPWTLVFNAPSQFDGPGPRRLASVTFAGGLIVASALFAVVAAQIRARKSAEEHAAELRASEEALRESEARLRRLVVLEREARAEAQAADRAKDDFLATLSHELRTPLNAMLGWITILRAGKVREDRRADAMEVIERNARAQARLIEDLLDVSRIIAGKVQLDLQPMQLATTVQTVLETMRPAADGKKVHLRAAIAPHVPPIHGDAERLQQVLSNLVSNAVKFTPPGGIITVGLQSVGDGVELSVRDTGIGIEADFLPHVFERFRQADTSVTRIHGGVGLGLAIVRHLVEVHGGRISAESEGRDRGSLFVVWLPLSPPLSALE